MKFLVLEHENGKKTVIKSVFNSSRHLFASQARRRIELTLGLKFGFRTSWRLLMNLMNKKLLNCGNYCRWLPIRDFKIFPTVKVKFLSLGHISNLC
jgi:hypothetical protein